MQGIGGDECRAAGAGVDEDWNSAAAAAVTGGKGGAGRGRRGRRVKSLREAAAAKAR